MINLRNKENCINSRSMTAEFSAVIDLFICNGFKLYFCEEFGDILIEYLAFLVYNERIRCKN